MLLGHIFHGPIITLFNFSGTSLYLSFSIEKHEADLEEFKRGLESLNKDVLFLITSPED